jgi:cytochrome c-type biogenesis protein CcmE|tara:strand:- start:343 stop:771 length:429 start_codon:yes stop_codon:yes gene_type:complete
MLTRKVKNRISIFVFFALLTIISIFVILKNLNKNILYFLTPAEINQREDIELNQKIRLGGMVKKDSISIKENEIMFVITDFENEIIVSYSGTVPNLFSEQKGVIAEGYLKDKNFFIAERILAKHDENYMPPELKKTLEKNAK